MRDVSIGQYYPADSVVHRADPRIKIIILTIYLVAVFFCESFVSFGILAACAAATILLSRVPILKVLASLKFILVLLVFTSVLVMIFYTDASEPPIAVWWRFAVYRSGVYAAAKLGSRLTLLMLMPTVLTFTSTPTELCAALESLMSPLKLLRVPVHIIALIMSIALRFIPTLMEETDKIINAQKARCAPLESKNPFRKIKAMIPVLIPLFVSSLRRADELADAMDSRCYSGAAKRTRYKKFGIRPSDIVALLFWCGILTVIILLKYYICL